MRELRSNVGIALGSNLSGGNRGNIHETMALWDTGATNCAITQATITALNLIPTGKGISQHAGGQEEVDTYLIDVYLPNKFIIPNITAIKCHDSVGRFGLIIGMDIITLGDFSVTNLAGKTTFSFRMPSMHRVDYVQENKEQLSLSKSTATKPTKIKAGDPCYCGSGKRYKNCHGRTKI